MSDDLRAVVPLGCRLLGAADQGDLVQGAWGHLVRRLDRS